MMLVSSSSYDADQQYLCYGFGARIGNDVSHCFSLVSAPIKSRRLFRQYIGGKLQVYLS